MSISEYNAARPPSDDAENRGLISTVSRSISQQIEHQLGFVTMSGNHPPNVSNSASEKTLSDVHCTSNLHTSLGTHTLPVGDKPEGVSEMYTNKTINMAGSALAIFIGVTTPTLAETQPLISAADVKVELEDINANALEYWPTIERDLEAKFKSEIAPVFSGEGYDITVRLIEISVDGSALLGNEGEFNTLKGWVYIREKGNPDPVESVRVNLVAKTGDAQVDAPERTLVIPPARNAFYDALLSRFAERTVEEVAEL